MTLDKNDPLYKQALEHGMTEEQIETIVRFSGVDGLRKVVGRNNPTTANIADDDDWQPEVVVETVGVDDRPSIMTLGCYPVILMFVLMFLAMGIGDKFFGEYLSAHKHPVLSFAAFFMMLGVVGGLGMFIHSRTARYVGYGWALIRKNWWKALVALWVISAALQLLFGSPAEVAQDDAFPPMPEASQNSAPDVPLKDSPPKDTPPTEQP